MHNDKNPSSQFSNTFSQYYVHSACMHAVVYAHVPLNFKYLSHQKLLNLFYKGFKLVCFELLNKVWYHMLLYFNRKKVLTVSESHLTQRGMDDVLD